MVRTRPLPLDDLEPTFRGFLTSHGETALAYARWDRPGARGRVVLSHGYGEHGERYRHTAHWLNSEGWSVSALDHRGFGRSAGVRGDARGIRAFVEDMASFLRHERQFDAVSAGSGPVLAGGIPVGAAPACPQVLLGHSFGGLVALLVLLWHPDALDGLVLSSPALKIRELPFRLRALQKLLYWVAPHHPLDLSNDKDLVCSDPVFVQRYWADPLCHRFVTAAFMAALTEGREEILSLGAELDRPILLLEGGQDTVVDPDASERLWAAVRPELLERHRLEAFRHEIFHDLNRLGAQALASRWLDRVFPIPAGTSTPPFPPLNEELKETP